MLPCRPLLLTLLAPLLALAAPAPPPQPPPVAVTLRNLELGADLRGRRRYLKPTTGYAATNSLSLIAVLHNGADAPNTAAEVNAVNVANI